MRWVERMRMLFRSLFHRRQMEQEMESELRDHLQQEIDNNLRAGMTPEEATFAARRLTGSVGLFQEQCRDARSTAGLEHIVRDVRYACRTLGRTPLFTVSAIVTLALGIGATTTVFTFVENIILRSLPVRNPQQIVFLNWGQVVNISYPNYRDFRDRNSTFSNLIACRYNPANVSLRPRENFRLWGYEATGNYFQTLGIRPHLGRFFGPKEDRRPGANPVVVVSYRCWRDRFASDPRAVGQSVKINGFPFTLIGVAPPDFSGTEFILSADYWVPMSMETQVEPGNNWLESRGSNQVWVMGRLRPSVSRRQAEAELDGIGRQLGRAYPDKFDTKAKFYLSSPGLIGQYLRGAVSGFGAAFMAVAGVALLLACANLSCMLLARASDRSREISIRLAVGASRLQLLRQLMIESLLLSLGGGALGVALAFGACGLMSAWRPDFDIPISTGLHPNSFVLYFALATTLLTTLLFGMAPALQAVRTDLTHGITNEPVSQHLRRWSIRDLLVAGQIALSVTLVICSALVMRSLQHTLTLNLGFNPRNAVSVSVDLDLQRYSTDQRRHFHAELLRKTSLLPGVESVGVANSLPLRSDKNNGVVTRADRPIPKIENRRSSIIYKISTGYLQAAGTRLLAGRDINSYDRAGAVPVAIINEALAKFLFGSENPLSKPLRLTDDPKDKGITVAGVVETGKYESLGEDPKPVIFLPLAQFETGSTTLVARTHLPADQATALLRKTVLDLDPSMTISSAGSLQDQLALPLFPARIAAIVLSVFGALAMVLAATGLFALMAYAVSRRSREIGIRVALGAQPGQLLLSIFRRTVVLCFVGLFAGTLFTFLGSRVLSSILYDVSPHDPQAYLSAIGLMIVVALAASWHPALRTIRTDPARTLRES